MKSLPSIFLFAVIFISQHSWAHPGTEMLSFIAEKLSQSSEGVLVRSTLFDTGVPLQELVFETNSDNNYKIRLTQLIGGKLDRKTGVTTAIPGPMFLLVILPKTEKVTKGPELDSYFRAMNRLDDALDDLYARYPSRCEGCRPIVRPARWAGQQVYTLDAELLDAEAVTDALEEVINNP